MLTKDAPHRIGSHRQSDLHCSLATGGKRHHSDRRTRNCVCLHCTLHLNRSKCACPDKNVAVICTAFLHLHIPWQCALMKNNYNHLRSHFTAPLSRKLYMRISTLKLLGPVCSIQHPRRNNMYVTWRFAQQHSNTVLLCSQNQNGRQHLLIVVCISETNKSSQI